MLLQHPPHQRLELIASVLSSTEDSAVIFAKLLVEGKVYATCEGKFVAVEPGHPAYHHW